MQRESIRETVSASEIVNFLTGRMGNISEYISIDPQLVTKCVSYQLSQKYHRKNMCETIVKLINEADPKYRGNGWALLQKVRLSHLIGIVDILENKLNTRRLRHAIVTKISNSRESEILYAYLIDTNRFRDLFEKMYLPKSKIDGVLITNKSYIMALKLSQMPMEEALSTFVPKKSDLLVKYKLPLERIMHLFETEEEAIELSSTLKNDSFFRHGRWLKEKVGVEKYEELALERVKGITNPIYFLSQKKHLMETDSMTDTIMDEIEKLAKEQMNKLLEEKNIERLALIVDTSPSMEHAIEITDKLYHGFKMDFTDVIEFNSTARVVIDPNKITELQTRGMTSIGSSIVLLSKRIVQRKLKKIPQAIVMVTDMDENQAPFLKDTLKLLKEFGSPPLIIVNCRVKFFDGMIETNNPKMGNYPHTIIEAEEFHPSLVQQIIESIVSSASKMIEEKEITEIVPKRKLLEEKIAEAKVPIRPKYTYFKGFLKVTLTHNTRKEVIEYYTNEQNRLRELKDVISNGKTMNLRKFCEIVRVDEEIVKSEISSEIKATLRGKTITFQPKADAQSILEYYWGVPCDKCGYVENPSQKNCSYCGHSL